jgi:hypothetical protein
MRYDIAAYGPNGGLVAVIQNRLRRGTDKEWAAQFRANLFANVGVPDGGFFAIITPDKIYLWSAGTAYEALPCFEVDALPIFEPYYSRIDATVDTIGSLAFDSLIAWWLGDVALAPRPEVVQGLGQTGFVDAIFDARLELGDAA